MTYHGYVWDLSPTKIIPDEQLNTDKLNWQAGDMWRVVEVDGKKILEKLDPLVKFTMGID
jgi:hypothetical protein